MPRIRRTNQELLNASEQLHYEYTMLLRLTQLLEYEAFGKGIVLNALLESFIRRVYNMLCFLYPVEPDQQQAIAVDFFPEQGDWAAYCPKISAALKKARKRTGAEVGGLVYGKGAFDDSAWKYSQLVDEIEYVFRRFLTTCPPKNLSRIWDGLREMYGE